MMAVCRLGVIAIVLTALLCVGGASALAQTPDSTSADVTEEAEPSPTTDVEAEPGGSEAETSEVFGDLGDAGSFQPPEPAMTPGAVAEIVADVTERTGLAEVSFLGLSGEDWINLGISLLIILAGYLIGTWVIRRLLPRAVRRTSTEFDDALLAAIGGEVRWLVVLFFLWFAIVRLVFLSV